VRPVTVASALRLGAREAVGTPAAVLAAGFIGLAGSYLLPAKFDVIKGKTAQDFDAGYVQICDDPAVCHINPSAGRNILLLTVFAGLWVIPVTVLYAFMPGRLFYEEALFFSKAALLTFGGAYAVLAYIAQAGVELDYKYDEVQKY